MSLDAIAERLREANGLAGFSATPAVSTTTAQRATDFEHWDLRPITMTEFALKLPHIIVDPKSGRDITISQSRIKAIREMDLGQRCPHRVYRVDLLEEFEDGDSATMAAGRRFEYELTGSLDRNGNVPDELLTEKRREPSAAQRRVSANADFGRVTLNRLGVPRHMSTEPGDGGYITQHRSQFACLTGSFDLRYELPDGTTCVDDIKYSGLLGDTGKFSPLGWSVDEVGDRFGHICQAAHYTLLAKLEALDPSHQVRFRFIVFDSREGREGEYLPFEFTISDAKMIAHMNLVLRVVVEIVQRLEDTDEANFRPTPDYWLCRGCPVSDCSVRREFPDVQVVEV